MCGGSKLWKRWCVVGHGEGEGELMVRYGKYGSIDKDFSGGLLLRAT